MKPGKMFIRTMLYTAFILSSISCDSKKSEMRNVINNSLNFSAKQTLYMFEQLKDSIGKFPKSAENDQLITCKHNWWTSGFFPGTLWYLYEETGKPGLQSAAEIMSERVKPELQNPNQDHDLGFIFNCSFGNGYRITQKEEYKEILNEAAACLAKRFNTTVGCTRSWNNKHWEFPVIIDNMMNMELFAVASAYTKNNHFYDMAVSHSDKTLENHFRSNFSSYHLVSYDTVNGNAVQKETFQGHSDESAWSRGQAWALYGYTMMYRVTLKKRYLQQAENIAKFIINHPNLPDDKIPYWDFDAPDIPNAHRDASAGAILASALVELSTYLNGKISHECLKVSEQQIRSLASNKYRAQQVGDNAGFILMHSTGFMARGSEIDVPLPYADYYFVEALLRYKRLLEKKPVVDMIK